jgi:prophage regulatory protein
VKWTLVGPGEIGEMLGGVSRQRVFQLTSRPDFPGPVQILASGKVWSYAEVRAWAERAGRTVHPIADR